MHLRFMHFIVCKYYVKNKETKNLSKYWTLSTPLYSRVNIMILAFTLKCMKEKVKWIVGKVVKIKIHKQPVNKKIVRRKPVNIFLKSLF